LIAGLTRSVVARSPEHCPDNCSGGSVTSALEPLRMGRKLDPYRKTALIVLEPWLLEAALTQLPQPLSPADQRIAVKAIPGPGMACTSGTHNGNYCATYRRSAWDEDSANFHDGRGADSQPAAIF
jgi:hypothetical protein